MKSQLCVLVIILLALPAAVSAQTRYVSDSLVITFRTGPSSQNSITRNLSSGDRVEVVEELQDEGWSRVRLPDGEEGWVLSRYLQPDPTAELELATVSSQLAATQNRADELEQQADRLQAELDVALESLAQFESSANRLETELADVRSASSNALTIRDENEELRSRVSELTSDINLAEIENAELRSRERQNWFIVGAAVLFGGIVIGLIAPSLRRRRKSSW